MLQDALKSRLDTSRFDVALPSPEQLKNEIFGDLGGVFGTPQGHIGALMGSLIPQWAESAPKASKGGKGRTKRAQESKERTAVRKGSKR